MCDKGYLGTGAGVGFCSECPEDTYKDTVGDTNMGCTDCPMGKTTITLTGRMAEADCGEDLFVFVQFQAFCASVANSTLGKPALTLSFPRVLRTFCPTQTSFHFCKMQTFLIRFLLTFERRPSLNCFFSFFFSVKTQLQEKKTQSSTSGKLSFNEDRSKQRLSLTCMAE